MCSWMSVNGRAIACGAARILERKTRAGRQDPLHMPKQIQRNFTSSHTKFQAAKLPPITVQKRENPSREFHLEQLTQLYRQSASITCPAELKHYCPHLDDQEVDQLLKEAISKAEAFFAAPSILLKGAYHVLRLTTTEPKSETILKKGVCLEYGFPKRTRGSYSDGEAREEIYYETPFSEKAMHYSEANWSESLIIDEGKSYGRIFLQDPKDLFENGTSKTKAVIYWLSNKEWDDFTSENVWDASIIKYTFNPIEGVELRGNRSGATEYHCSRCGEALHLTACKVCNAVFKDDGFRSQSSSGHLPNTMIKTLKSRGLLDKK